MPAEAVRGIIQARREWSDRIRPLWVAAAGNRAALARGVAKASRGRVPAAAAYAHALDILVRRPALRPVDLANQLAAWQESVSVRCVRTVMRAARTPRSADRLFA